jgi:hypothetical protein
MLTSRRSLLRTLAVGAGAMPALAPLGRAFLPNAHAASTGAPRRIVFIDIPNGVPETAGGFDDDWVKASTSPTDFKMGTMMQPLARHRSELVVIDGIELKRPQQQADAHNTGMVQLLTGKYPPGDGRLGKSSNQSVDQYMADKLGKLVTPSWPFVSMSVGTRGASHSYSPALVMVPANESPYDLYAKMFANLVTTGAATPAGPDPKLLARLARRKSVLDVVAADLKDFRARLPAEDRARADAQLSALRTLEDRLGAGLTTGGATCSKPAQTAGVDLKSDASFPAIARMHMGVIASAFACDLTRIALLQLRYKDFQVGTLPFAPINQPYSLHGLSHNQGNDAFAGFRTAKTFFFSLAAELIDALKAVPEAGGTMLDNTIVFIGSEISRGHANVRMPMVTVGGKNMGIAGGRLLTVVQGRSDVFGKGVSHTRLLVSFLNAMGLPDETFGEGDDLGVPTGKGPLEGYAA